MTLLSRCHRHSALLSLRERRLIALMPDGGGELMRPAEPPMDAQPDTGPKPPEETRQQPEAKQDKGMEMRSLFGEDPQALVDYADRGYVEKTEQSAALTSAHINLMAENEQNMLSVIQKNPNFSSSVLNKYVERRNAELHPRGLHMSVDAGKVKFSPNNTGPEDPRNTEIARVKDELGAVNSRIYSLQKRFGGAGSEYTKLNRAKYNPRNRAPEITGLAQRGSAQDAMAYASEWEGLRDQKRALESRLDGLKMDKRLNPAGSPSGSPEEEQDGEPTFESPGRPDRRYDLEDQNRDGTDAPGGQGQEKERGGTMRNVPEESYPLSKESPDRVRAVMKAVERFTKAKTEEDQQIAEGAMRLLGVDVDASNLQSGKPEDISITGKNDRVGNMIVGLFQWVGGWFRKLGGKKTSLENKNPKQKEVKDMTPEERTKEKESIGKSLEKNAKMTQESTGRIKELEQEKTKEGLSEEDKGKIDEKIGVLKKDLDALKSERQALEARNKELGGSRKEAKDMTPDERATEKTDNEEKVKENGEKLKKLTEDIQKLEQEKAEKGLDPADKAQLKEKWTALEPRAKEVMAESIKILVDLFKSPDQALKDRAASLKERRDALTKEMATLKEDIAASREKNQTRLAGKISGLQENMAALTKETGELETRNKDLKDQDKPADAPPDKPAAAAPAKEGAPMAPPDQAKAAEPQNEAEKAAGSPAAKPGTPVDRKAAEKAADIPADAPAAKQPAEAPKQEAEAPAKEPPTAPPPAPAEKPAAPAKQEAAPPPAAASAPEAKDPAPGTQNKPAEVPTEKAE